MFSLPVYMNADVAEMFDLGDFLCTSFKQGGEKRESSEHTWMIK